MSNAGGPTQMIDDAERFLVERLSLRPVELPPQFKVFHGEWKAEPVTISTRAYDGEVVRYSRFVSIQGSGLLIGNLLVLAKASYSLPILGADLVALGGKQMMVAVDLSPAFPPGPDRMAMDATVGAALNARPPLPSGGDLPAWCAALFSPHALYTRVDAADRERAAAAFRLYPEAFDFLAREAKPKPELAEIVRKSQDAYAAAHRIDDKGLGLLAKMFGKDWADQYLKDVLFP